MVSLGTGTEICIPISSRLMVGPASHMCLRPGPVHTRYWFTEGLMSRHREGLLQLPHSPGAHLPIRQDTLSDLTHQDKEQHEGKDPAQVVAREMEPGAMVNVYFGALAAPSCGERRRRQDAHLEAQHGDKETMQILLPQG